MFVNDAHTILSRIRSERLKYYVFAGTPLYRTFRDLKDLRHITVDLDDYCSITPSGLELLSSLQQQLDQQAQQEQERQRAADAASAKEVMDRKREFRIKLIRSAFDLALPFLKERLPVVVDFFKQCLVRITSLFH